MQLPIPEEAYQRHSFDGLVTAVECGDPTAHQAVKEFIRLRSAGRGTIIERHPRHGWRVREAGAVLD